MRQLLSWAGLCVVFGCSATAPLAAPSDETTSEEAPGINAPVVPRELEFHLVFVHGVQSDADGKQTAERSLVSLETELRARLTSRVAEYEATHPHVRLRFDTHRVNLYVQPGGSLRTPSPDEVSDGSGVPSATAWRSALAESLAAALPPTARNIILVGHSTGGRVTMEVAANVGGEGTVGAYDWGWQERIAGVVSVNGMIHSLGRGQFNFLGTLSYETGCRLGQGRGWCDYSALISGVPAADWVAQNKRALMLVSAGACSPSLWTGESDQALPLRAQASPLAPGMTMTSYPDDSVGPAHGLRYGAFCHTDITNTESPRHLGARDAVATAITDWLFRSAPRVTGSAPFTTDLLPEEAWSPPFSAGSLCAPGERESGFDVLGTCLHTGGRDGKDHALDETSVLHLRSTGPCTGAARWQHRDAGTRGAKLWMKLSSEPEGGGLLSTLR